MKECNIPVYEYECLKCKIKFEEEQKISDKPLEKCPVCKYVVRRTIPKTSFILKGKGFHKNDYREK